MRPVRVPTAIRLLRFISIPLLVCAISLFAFAGIASAHVITSMTADCYQVTVRFSDFPTSGVIVHIAADVNGQPISTDVHVTNATTEAHLDISAATATLVDTPAHIKVDVTWTYLGPQHAHQSLTLVCGSPTSTPVTQSVAPATTAAPVTTTIPATTTTSPATTSTQVRGTTIVATPTAPTTTTTETVRRQGVSVVATTTTAPAIATLPRTGSDPTFPLIFGLSSLTAGGLLLLRQRRAPGRANQDWSPTP